jgi:hypothetical protein
MRVRTRGIEIAAGLLALCAASLSVATPCYVILDRNDVVVYRDTAPPFDLSSAGATNQAILRQRGQHLLIAEFDQCYSVGYISPTTGATTATVDEIVMQLKPAIGTSVGSPGGGSVTSAAGGSTSPRAASAPAAAPASASKGKY